MSATTIEETVAAWTADPEPARSTPTVTARAEDTQALIQAGPFTWRADLPGPLGGTNTAPSPVAQLLGALAGCAVVFVKDTLGPQLGIPVDGVEVTVRCEMDARGLVGMEGAEADLRGISVDVTVDSPDGASGVAEIAGAWEERCPVYLALEKPMGVQVRFGAA